MSGQSTGPTSSYRALQEQLAAAKAELVAQKNATEMHASLRAETLKANASLRAQLAATEADHQSEVDALRIERRLSDAEHRAELAALRLALQAHDCCYGDTPGLVHCPLAAPCTTHRLAAMARALQLTEECGVGEGNPRCGGTPSLFTPEEQWCRMCLLALYRSRGIELAALAHTRTEQASQ